MNIKLQIEEVVLLLDRRISMTQVCKRLTPLAQQAELLFPDPQVGAGYLQWTLPEGGWIPFSKVSDSQKAVVAQIYHERKAFMWSLLAGSSLAEIIFTIPSEEFIYCCPNKDGWDIALVAWAYKYPNIPPSRELDSLIEKSVLQMVNIGFEWNGRLLPEFNFFLMSQPRTTSADGWFHIDRPLSVGRTLQVNTKSGREFILTVEQGQADYVLDLTQYVSIEIEVRQDGIPAVNYSCDIVAGGESDTLITDDSGRISQPLALKCDAHGLLEQPQPCCCVTCNSETQQQTPLAEGDVLCFLFNFVTLEPTSEPTPEPIAEPVLGVFKPEPSSQPVPESIPEFVHLRLLDYGGFPLPGLAFVLKTKKKGSVSLETDGDGHCLIPKDWFTHKEKMQVKFVITADYMASHDLHDPKNKKKK